MKKQFFIILALCFAVVTTGNVFAHEKYNENVSCCKGDVSKNLYMDYKGKRIYFCCAPSMEKFRKDPDKYIKEMEAIGMTFDSALKAQETCPITGMKVTSKSIFVDYDGVNIYACCADCLGKIEADKAKYVKVLQNRGESPIVCFSKCSSTDSETFSGFGIGQEDPQWSVP